MTTFRGVPINIPNSSSCTLALSGHVDALEYYKEKRLSICSSNQGIFILDSHYTYRWLHMGSIYAI